MTNDDRKFYINWEAADQITITNLKDQYDYLSSENAEFEKDDDLPEHKYSDMVYNTKLMKALKLVLQHYGVDVE